MIGISDLQQIQVIVKLPLHQLLWKSSTRSLLTAGSSTLDMCSTCCILVTKTTASTAIDPHGLLGMGSGWSRPTGLCVLILFAWQTPHKSQYFSTSTQS